jgi:hypothetical protein
MTVLSENLLRQTACRPRHADSRDGTTISSDDSSHAPDSFRRLAVIDGISGTPDPAQMPEEGFLGRHRLPGSRDEWNRDQYDVELTLGKAAR